MLSIDQEGMKELPVEGSTVDLSKSLQRDSGETNKMDETQNFTEMKLT